MHGTSLNGSKTFLRVEIQCIMQRYCRSHLVPHTSTVKSGIGGSITNVDFGLFRPNKIPEFHEVKIQQQSNLVTSYTKHYCIQATSRSSLKGQI
jgi:hypothetical protein